jgi:hypothetical protein
MKLLIIKAGKDYYRFTDAGHEVSTLQKASVYPIEHLTLAREKRDLLKSQGVDAALFLLNITEELFEK